MKKILIACCCCMILNPIFALKKKKVKELIKISRAVYSNRDNSIRKVGHVYEFTIQTLTSNILVDSIWFGATPVPCDMLEPIKRHKVAQAHTKGTYIIQANKNLYANFPGQYDSTNAYQHFIAPFAFSGDAVIMYTVNGKRFYKVVKEAMEVKAKGMRK